jgi:hexosaminidase
MRTPRILPVVAMSLFSACFGAVRAGADEPTKDATPARQAAIVPQPVKIEKLDSPPLATNPGSLLTTGYGKGVDGKLIALADSIFRKAMGYEPSELSKKMPPGYVDVVKLTLDDSVGKGRPDWQAAESYSLIVRPEKSEIEIAASNEHGLFNGVQSLAQLLDKGADGKWRVPAVKIEDYPRFPWRGYLLDPARHFRPKAEVLRYIDLLAMHKMNVFHLHLTDDQGWRIEIKRYPKLVEVGARLPNYSGQKGDGWYYSQADVKEIVAYAADRFVTVVPEIEMPGHCRAATTSYPELSCDGKPASELCAGKESTFEFMANVLDEVAELFPSKFIHIGADEVQPAHWRACPHCKKRMDELAAAKRPDDVEVFHVQVTSGAGVPFNEDVAILEGEFVRKIDRHLAEKGKRMVGWDEILDGGLQKDSRAAVMAWRGGVAIGGATKLGRDVAACVYPESYLDNDVSLEVTYAVEPAPADMPQEHATHVLGVQGNMWGERTPTQATVDHQTFPRLCAIAEIGWTPLSARDFKDFSARLERHAERLEPFGISLAPKSPGE